MVAPDTVASRPTVSVIVPARNEEASLGACLQSLAAQGGVSFEIIVVDDASTDRTREIAQSFPSVRIVDAGPPPSGWTGKNNAMYAGQKVARGEWLLFTDADTVHKPGSLARAVERSPTAWSGMLSYSPEQEVHGFWENAVMPVIFAELAATYRPSLVSDPKSPAAAANGQYILIARETYDAIGGHAAVSGSLLEDVALAKAVKASGRKIFFRFGGDAVRTRMYRSFFPTSRGLDQKSGTAVSRTSKTGTAQIDRVSADRRWLRRGSRGAVARSFQARACGGGFGGYDLRFSSESNSQSAFFLGGKRVVARGPAALCVSVVAIQTVIQAREGALEGKNLRRKHLAWKCGNPCPKTAAHGRA